MKRSDLFIRITTAVLFLAVASYIGVYIYNSAINTFVTADAISYIIEESYPAQGFIVRTETVIADDGDTVMPIVGDGEKVAKGQAIAVEYLSREAMETASEIQILRMRIEKLEAPAGAAESVRRESVMALSTAIHSGDLSMLDELILNIETYVFAKGYAQEEDLPTLRARLDALENNIRDVRTITAPVSGIYSHVVDGYEYIKPGDLSEISPTRLTEMFGAQSGVYKAGKLVTEFKWYYAAIMDFDAAIRLPLGQLITVQFSGIYNEGVQMLIESVGRREEGRSVVLFSSDRSIHEIASLRALSADIVFDMISGIRIPKEAIHLDDDGTTFVYLQTGARAERVNVEILFDSGDYYLVRDGAETGTPLRAGSTIIVKANNLYHGKVVA